MKPFFLLVAGGLIVLALGALALWRGESVLNRADPENADQVARGIPELIRDTGPLSPQLLDW